MQSPPERIGAGLSGEVFRLIDDQGRDIARKIFKGSTLTKIVHYVITGAPNPYIWNENAVRAAVARRQILTRLCQMWFGNTMAVAEAFGCRFNEEVRAYEIDTEFIEGRHAQLHQPFSRGNRELDDLYRDILTPLQQYLKDAGLDGLLWQAGGGNPVAANNFLYRAKTRQWVWIDLESGVPALIPIDPRWLFGFYIPKSFHHRSPLFDNVDVPKLWRYIQGHAGQIAERCGDTAFDELQQLTKQLDEQQTAWKHQRRVLRSITYQLKRGRISERQAAWYAKHPIRWYLRCGIHAVSRAPTVIGRKIISRIRAVPYGEIAKGAYRFFTSQKYRTRAGRLLVSRRIDAWHARGQLTDGQAQELREHVDREDAGVYITDFAVHLAIKPIVKTLEWWVAPALFAMGLLSKETLLLTLASGGSIGRTAYTLYRLMRAFVKRREKPWVALAVGVLPVVGNAAYPLQIVYSGIGKGHCLAQFIVYDLFTTLGQKFPIWGGPDTLTEHLFNRLPNRILPKLKMETDEPPQPDIAGVEAIHLPAKVTE